MDTYEDKVLLFKSVLKNSLALLGVKIFMPLTYLIVTVSIARLLGIKDFGTFSIIVGYYAVFRVLSIFGIDFFLMREIPKSEEKAGLYLSNAYLLGTLFSIASIFLMNALLFCAGYPHDVRIPAFILSLSLWPVSLIRYTESVFIAFRKNRYVLFTASARESLKLIVVMWVLISYRSLTLAMMALSCSYFLGFVLNVVTINRRLFLQRLSFAKQICRDILKVSSILAVTLGVNNLFLVIDIIVLSKIKGQVSVGFYSAAYKFITLAFLFIDSIGTTLLPVMSRYYQQSVGAFRELSETIFKYFMVFTLLFVITVFFFSGRLIVLIFGDQYIHSSLALNVLVWCALFLGGSYFFAKMLFVANMQRYDLIAFISASLTNFLLNIYFTMRWGYLGTAAATLISTAFLFSMHFYFLYARVFPPNVFHIVIKPLIAGVLCFISFMYASKAGLYLGAASSLFVYGLALIVLGVVKKEELALFKKALFTGRQKR